MTNPEYGPPAADAAVPLTDTLVEYDVVVGMIAPPMVAPVTIFTFSPKLRL